MGELVVERHHLVERSANVEGIAFYLHFTDAVVRRSIVVGVCMEYLCCGLSVLDGSCNESMLHHSISVIECQSNVLTAILVSECKCTFGGKTQIYGITLCSEVDTFYSHLITSQLGFNTDLRYGLCIV